MENCSSQLDLWLALKQCAHRFPIGYHLKLALETVPCTPPHSSMHVLHLAHKPGIHPQVAGIEPLKADTACSTKQGVHSERCAGVLMVEDSHPALKSML